MSYRFLEEQMLQSSAQYALDKIIRNESKKRLINFILQKSNISDISVGSEQGITLYILNHLGFDKIFSKTFETKSFYEKEHFEFLYNPKIGILKLKFGDGKLSQADIYSNLTIKKSLHREEEFESGINFTTTFAQKRPTGCASFYYSAEIKAGDLIATLGELLEKCKVISPMRVNDFIIDEKFLNEEQLEHLYQGNSFNRQNDIRNLFFNGLEEKYRNTFKKSIDDEKNLKNWASKNLYHFNELIYQNYKLISKKCNSKKLPLSFISKEDRNFYSSLGQIIANEPIDISNFLNNYKDHITKAGHTLWHGYVLMDKSMRDIIKPHLNPSLLGKEDLLGINPTLLICSAHNLDCFYNNRSEAVDIFKELSEYENFSSSLISLKGSFLDWMNYGNINRNTSFEFLNVFAQCNIKIPMVYFENKHSLLYKQELIAKHESFEAINKNINKINFEEFLHQCSIVNNFIDTKNQLGEAEKISNKKIKI